MSDLDTYKANFKTSNKYLKYFCNQPASNWTLEKFKKTFYDKDAEKAKKAFIKNLNIVKHDAKNIPSVVKQHIDREINSFSSATRDITNITVKGNYYHAERDILVNEAVERDTKKQKISHKGKEKESEDVEFTQKWVEFLADAENNKNFHRYSPEKNGVTRLGAKFSPHPHVDKDLYREMKKQIGQSQSYDFGADMKEYIINVLNADDAAKVKVPQSLVESKEDICQLTFDTLKIINKVYMKRPSISRSEVVYNTIMIFPCLEAMLSLMKDNDFEPYFVPGEDELEAMTKQLKKMGGKGDKRKIYKADGVIRLAQEDDLEILVLETAGAFGHDDHAKAAFDNSKGMFASLAMLKTIADKYKFASVTEFKKLRLYLVQPSERHIRLWSMQYAKHGIYNFVREDKVSIKEDSNDREEQLASLISFLLNLKVCLDKTTKAIASLKTEHDEKEKCYDSETNSQLVLLSEIICPDIFKSSFNTHGQHFAQEHFKSSPESDY